MNKTSLTALAIGVVALVAAGFAVLKPAEVKLGSYTNGGVINGNAQINNLIEGSLGYSSTFTTTSTITLTGFCAGTNILVANTTGTITLTFPSATSTYLACTGGFGAFGAWSPQLITNNSTNSVIFAAGPGQSFLCETNGVGTTTVTGGCTQTSVTVNASSSASVSGYWSNSSSSQFLLWGNEFFN